MRRLTLLMLFFFSFCARGLSQGALVQNQTFLYGPNTYLIATLPPNDGGDYDHLHLLVTLGLWGSTQNTFLDMTFGNRNAFTYSYTGRGAPLNSLVKVTAYRNADTSVSIYLSLLYLFSDAGYTILEADEEQVNPAPTSLTSEPSGTLIFDTSSPSYGPSTFTTFNGSFGIGTATPGSDLAALPSPPAPSTPVLEVGGVIALTQGGGGQFIYSDGSVQSTAWNGVLFGGDYAESVNVSGARDDYQPGDVLVIDPTSEGKFLKSSVPYSTAVTGIYSTKPGVVGRRQLTARTRMKEEVPMAMTGIVPTKVSAENGPIRPGDLLVTSSTSGYAMRGSDRTRMLGAVIGKAIGHLDTGKGVIEAVVTLQ